MPFRQDDIADRLRISAQTWRNWRATIPALQNRRGARAKFTSGEVLALMAIRTFMESYGMPIRYLAQYSDGIFEALRYENWRVARECTLIYRPKTGEVELTTYKEAAKRLFEGFMCTAPVGPLLDELEQAIHHDYSPAELGESQPR